MSLFERFMVVNKRRHEAAVAELQAAYDREFARADERQKQRDEALATATRLEGDKKQLIADGEFRDKRIAELEAELAPFREYVAAGEAEQPAEPGDGADGEPAEAQAG